MATGSPILQSGTVTPGHLASFVTDGVVGDAGVTLSNTQGQFVAVSTNINFNAANTDNPISINLPAGYTRYRISNILISGSSGTLASCTCGVFTGVGAGGNAVVAGGTAVTITTNVLDANNNMQFLTVIQQNTTAWSDIVLYFRVQAPQGVAATASVSIRYEPLP